MNQKSRTILGVDIGAHKIAVVVWSGAVEDKSVAVYPENIRKDAATWNRWTREWVEDFLSRQSLSPDAVGVAVAGVVEGSRVVTSPNLPLLNGKDMRQLFVNIAEEVRVENDANCFLRAEHALGAAVGMSNVVGLTLGSGVGGALLINGELYTGARGSAGEVGHMMLGEHTFEELASAQGFATYTDISPEELFSRAQEGDKEAHRIFTSVGTRLGCGIANLINICDPEVVLIGGGIAPALEFMLPAVQEEVKRLVLNPAARETPIIPGKLGGSAPAVGAALLYN